MHYIQISVCFFSILPLAGFLEFGGEQLAFYLGKDLGDLVRVTLSKYAPNDYVTCTHFSSHLVVLLKPRSPLYCSLIASE